MSEADIQRPASGLFYADSKAPVMFGDRVELISILFRRRRAGTVVCIPGQTGRQLATRGKAPDSWLVKLDSGVVTGWLYSPEDLQPTSRLRLLARASQPVDALSNEQLEAMERVEEDRATWLQLAMPALAVLLVGLAMVALVIWMRARY